MSFPRLAVLALAAALAGCAATGPAVAPGGPASTAPPEAPLGSPFSDRSLGVDAMAFPLLLDRDDLSLGTTVQYNRIPSAAELNDLRQIRGLQHLVIALPSWPEEYAPLEVLNLVPEESDVIVLLAGYPPSRGAANAWNLINVRLRIVVVVRSIPPNAGVVSDLNAMRGLERVVAQFEMPERVGFERLQRPLSFRLLRE